ncbi:MAG: flagellin [Enterococcus aquimarinus]|uniref:Flagellin n=1 Tax=Enterococcus aquimarinus TaxID=328396 RepID=A0A9E3ZTF3_9ENTE|nr:flagellin [Enterococcus aquimarinus]
MRINTNVSAMNTYGRLTNANASKSASLSKLSSGLRINKAGDDAAGLSISEKMKSQIGGLKQATRNAQDGISLIQTAEGALNETHAILGRMRDLATQGANGTLSQDDRAEVNKEFDALKEEITRISDTTEFNTKKLLNTPGQEFTFQIGANGGQTMKVTIGQMDADTLKLTDSVALSGDKVKDATKVEDYRIEKEKELTAAKAEKTAYVAKNTAALGTAATNASQALAKDDYAIKYAGQDTTTTILTAEEATAINAATGKTLATDGTATLADAAFGDPAAATGRATLEGTAQSTAKALNDAKKADTEANAEFDAKIAVAQAAVDNYEETVIDFVGRSNSSDAIKVIDKAIADVSAQRSDLGAAQNRLSHTVKNLTTTQENLSEANSRIRDVDMAEEMMEFTKNNILSQAATSMLSQANAMPNSVLGLLQG